MMTRHHISNLNEGAIRCNMVVNENVRRKRKVERLSNMFAVFAMLDSLITFPLVIYILRKEQFTELAAITGCIQISCLLLLSIISACIVLQTKQRYHERIDAIGAWLVIHIFNMTGNICIVVFELRPCLSNLWTTSIPLTVLIGWKGLFIVIEFIGLPYSFYVTQNAFRFTTYRNTTQHPLFSEDEENIHDLGDINSHQQPVYNRDEPGQIRVISCRNERLSVPQIYEDMRDSPPRRYDSYMSLSRHFLPYDGTTGPLPFNERYPRVLPNLPIGKVNLRNNNGDNMGYSTDGDISGPSTLGTSV